LSRLEQPSTHGTSASPSETVKIEVVSDRLRIANNRFDSSFETNQTKPVTVG